MNQINIEQVEDGRISEHWRETDELGMMRQLGRVVDDGITVLLPALRAIVDGGIKLAFRIDCSREQQAYILLANVHSSLIVNKIDIGR